VVEKGHADPSPEAFIFPNSDGGFLDTDGCRKRVLHKLAETLNLPNLTFQVIRRTIPTLSQRIGTVKDTPGLLRHSLTQTTTDEIPADPVRRREELGGLDPWGTEETERVQSLLGAPNGAEELGCASHQKRKMNQTGRRLWKFPT